MTKINIKWNKETYDVDLSTLSSSSSSSGPFAQLTSHLYSLTRVPVERQKLMAKGKMLKDDESIKALKDGDKVMLMGTADPPPAEPTKQVIFEEDLTDAQKSKVLKDGLSSGLKNLGNTCYMNSTVQCFRVIPELKDALVNFSKTAPRGSNDLSNVVTAQLGELLQTMDNTVQPVTPLMFTAALRAAFPQFAELSNEGGYMQHDAEECLSHLTTAMSQHIKGSDAQSVVDRIFGGKVEVKLSCQDPEAKSEEKVSVEVFRKLRCVITSDVNFLFQGIEMDLNEEVELRHARLGRNVLYKKTSTIIELPQYLTVQMGRFSWKKSANLKNKVLRKVDFPMKFDIQPFVGGNLKDQIYAARMIMKEEQDKKLGIASLSKKQKTDDAKMDDTAASTSGEPIKFLIESNGFYELVGIITHQGRSADSGHYVGWTKQKGDDWLKFDDDVVSSVKADDIKSLSGGGDWHMAYVLFYKRVDDMKEFIGREVARPLVAAPTASSSSSSSSSSASTSSSSSSS